MYGALVPTGIEDEEWGKLRIDTVKALLKGQDFVIGQEEKALKAQRADLEKEIARLEKVDKALDIENAKLEIAVIKDDH